MGSNVIDITSMVKKVDNPPNRLREIRLARKMTLKQVADQLGTTQTQISRFETGERDILFSWLRRLARVYGTNVGQLLNADDNPTSLDDRQEFVVDAMRHGPPVLGETLYRVAETAVTFKGDGAEVKTHPKAG